MKLAEMLDTDLLAREVADGYISCSVHPDDPSLKVLCYGKVTQITGHWNEATKQCRGLIIRSELDDFSDAEVVARPWRKFFTLQQVQSGWALGDEEEGTTIESDIAALDFEARAEVTDKIDGSMLVLYRHPDGLPAYSTKASFESEQAAHYTQLMRRHPVTCEAAENLLTQRPGETWISEGVGPSNQIVLAYPEDKIVLLGGVDHATGTYLSAKAVRGIWGDNGLEVAAVMPAHNLGEAVGIADREGKEGVVVRIISDDVEKQMQIKIKQQDYLVLHRLVTGFGEKAVRHAIMSCVVTFADLDRIASSGTSLDLPEVRNIVEFSDNPIFQNVRDKRREQFDAAIVPAAQAAARAKAYVAALPESDFAKDPREAKKQFALSITEAVKATGAPQGVLFTLAGARIAGEDLNCVDAGAVMAAAARTVKHTMTEEEQMT